MKQLIAELGKSRLRSGTTSFLKRGAQRHCTCCIWMWFQRKNRPSVSSSGIWWSGSFSAERENLRPYLRIGIRCCSEPSPQVFCAGVSADSGTCAVRSNAQRWETLSAIAHALCDLLESDPDYFLRPCVPKRTASFPIAEEIKREFQSGNHVVFLSGKNVLRLRQAADSYRFQNRRRYLHTAQGTAENGLRRCWKGRRLRSTPAHRLSPHEFPP